MLVKTKVATIGLLSLAVICMGCGQGNQDTDSVPQRDTGTVAGTYNCGNEGEAAVDVLELRDDGTVTFTPKGEGAPPPDQGTWSVDGNGGVFKFPDFEDTFTTEGDRLEFAHAGSPEKFICTRAN